MKKLLLIIVTILSTTSGFSQYKLGISEKQLNAGFGLSSWGAPLYLGIDYGITNDISVGGEFSFRTRNQIYNKETYRQNTINIVANGNYHFVQLLQIPTEWDVYMGLNLGYYISSDSDSNSSISGVNMGAQVGGRYYFKEDIAFNIEFGGGSAFSSGKVGVSIIF